MENYLKFDKKLDDLIREYHISGFCVFQKPDGDWVTTSSIEPQEVIKIMRQMIVEDDFMKATKNGNA